MLANQLMTGALTVRMGGMLLTDSSCWAIVNWRRLVKIGKMDSHSYDKPYWWHTELMTATNGEWFLLFYVRPLLKRTMVPLKSLCVQVQYLIVSIILSYQKHFFPVWGSWIFYSSLGGKKTTTKQNKQIPLIIVTIIVIILKLQKVLVLNSSPERAVFFKHKTETFLSSLFLYSQKQRPTDTWVHFVEKRCGILIKNAC